MDCDVFQGSIPELLYGELPAEEAGAARAHAGSCAACGALLAELRGVRGALPRLEPPPLLAARVKLAARDELLAGRAGGPGDRGGTLRLVAASVLGLCVGGVGFALGVGWERRQTAEGPEQIPVPQGPLQPDGGELHEIGVEIGPRPGPGVGAPVPRAPEAWQRVLYDAASEYLDRGDHGQALEFFRRAAEVAPEGPLAVAARLGAAEACLGRGDRDGARAALLPVRVGLEDGRLQLTSGLLSKLEALERRARGGG